eukprot:6711501-Alexandrium_andersonii.AAC.1
MRNRLRASRGASCAWQCNKGVSEFRRFGATERAVWSIGRAGIAAPSGWLLGPELTSTSH